jgi:3-oxoacyl-[acyl-carrier-protein] synthase II
VSTLGADAERRIVVTGLGAVSAWGWGSESLWSGLLAGTTRVSTARRFDASRQRTRMAGEVPEAPPLVVAGMSEWRRLAQADRFGVAAAREAVRQAGLGEPPAFDRGHLGVFFGSSTAGMWEGEEFYGRAIGALPGRASLRLLTSQQINGPGDAAARALGAAGPVYTVSSACSSGALAIGEALRALRDGEVEIAVAGGSDSLCRLTYSGFNSLRAVDERACRPFRADRAGLSLGEGAGVLVLERWESAAARGARALAELIGFGASCDCHHMTAPHPEGAGAAQAMRRALEDAALAPEAVSFVNAHGTGTPLNDAAEWRALEAVFGARARELPTTSIKGALGHLLGSAGAIEAVATVQSLVAGLVPPTAGEGDVDPALAIDLVRDEPRPLNGPSVGISTSLAFGGANGALLFAGGANREAA